MNKTEIVRIAYEKRTVERNDRPYEYAFVTAYDENDAILWTHQSDFFDVAQVDACTEIGCASYGYLIAEGHSIVCLDAATGRELWRNRDFQGGGATFCFDGKERLCICGYFGPELLVIDKDGRTCTLAEKVVPDDSYFWTTIIGFQNGRVLLRYESGSHGEECVFSVDPDTLEYT